MNKGDLIEAVAAELNASRAEGAKALDAVLAAITTGLRADGKVVITGFGAFARRARPARAGINPATKQPITIPAGVACTFKPSDGLKSAIQ